MVNETGLLQQVDVILLEEDSLESYRPWHEQFHANDFSCIW
jgi:hypothetical protein